MLAESVAFALLGQHPFEPRPQGFRERHVAHACLRISERKQTSQLAAWLREWDWLGAARCWDRLGARLQLVNQLPHLGRELSVAAASGLRGHLDGDRVEARVVAFRMAAEKRFHLL